MSLDYGYGAHDPLGIPLHSPDDISLQGRAEEMRIRVWLKGHEDDSKELELKGILTEPIFPMNVKDYLCRTGVFSWGDYQRIRYRRLKNGKTKKK